MSKDKVIFLAFSNPKTDVNTVTKEAEVLACENCGNKAWMMWYEDDDDYPSVKCTCCGNHIGKIGFIPAGDDHAN